MSSDRSTFKHAAVYSGAAVLSRLIGFLLLPLYAHELQAIGYGIIGMVDTAMNFLLSLLAQGIRGGLIRYYHEEPDPEAKGKVVSTGTALIAGATLVIVLLTMLVSRPLSAFMLGDGDLWPILCLGAGAFFFEVTGQTASTILIIKRRSVTFSFVSLVQLTMGLLLNVLFIIVLRWGVRGYFYAAILTAMITNVIFVSLMLKHCGRGWDTEVARKLIAFQLPLVPGSLASFFARQAERVLVRFNLAIESVGILEMAYKFPVLLTLLIHQPFMRSWDTRRVEIAEEPDGPYRIGRMYTYGLFLMLAGGLIMASCIEDLLRILTPQEFWIAHRFAKVEILTVLMQSSMYHFIFGIFYMKHTGDWAKVRGVMAVLKVGLSVLFILKWGLYGAAFSACVTMAVTLVWAGRIGMRYYGFPIEKAKVFSMITVAVAIFVLLQVSDFSGWRILEPARESWLPGFAEALRGTFLGTWKDGKAIVLLLERKELIVDLVVRGFFSASFLILLPLVHDPTRHKALGRLRRRPAASV